MLWLTLNGCQRVVKNKNSLERAKPNIVTFFKNLPKKILTNAEIDTFIHEQRASWGIAKSTTKSSLIKYLGENTEFKTIELGFPNRKMIRHCWGTPSIYMLVFSLKPQAYFTHFTAMHLHNLTNHFPKKIYLNVEQPPKYHEEGGLDQAGINAAFKRPPRISNNFAQYEGQEIFLLNGMHTGELGIVEFREPGEGQIKVTDLERTLIDITVRPAYSGGVVEVLNAYKLAKGKVLVDKLVKMLKKLDYIYPYHQAIGFYLERAGYDESTISLLRKFEMNYDFYLTHQMKEISYSKEWRIYFPKGL